MLTNTVLAAKEFHYVAHVKLYKNIFLTLLGLLTVFMFKRGATRHAIPKENKKNHCVFLYFLYEGANLVIPSP